MPHAQLSCTCDGKRANPMACAARLLEATQGCMFMVDVLRRQGESVQGEAMHISLT